MKYIDKISELQQQKHGQEVKNIIEQPIKLIYGY